MLPIEPGCLAVTIGHRLDCGTVVTVVRFVGQKSGWAVDCLWELDRPVHVYTESGWRTQDEPFIDERCLLRIDGYTETEELAQEATA